MSKHFRVVYEPDQGGWHAYIPDVKGCRTWGRTLATARTNIREALSLCEDVIPNAAKVAEHAELEDDVRLPGVSGPLLEEHKKAVEAWEAVGEKLREVKAKAARALTKNGISLRDAGELLGLSHGRVKQIVDEAPKAKRTKSKSKHVGG